MRIAITLALVPSAILVAQDPSVQQRPIPTITTNVRQVVVPVTVMDKKGHHVSGLKAADFRVFEDGTPEEIVSFSTDASGWDMNSLRVPDDPRAPVAPQTLPGSDRPRQTYLVCIDVLHSSFANFGRVRAALLKFFEQQKPGDSQYALIALGREPNVIVDSTRDPSIIVAALQSKAFLKAIQNSEASSTAMDAQNLTSLMGDYCAACACAARPLDGPDCEGIRGRVRGFLLTAGERTFVLNENFLRYLGEFVSAITTMPTTRNVLFVSDGFNRFPGRELYEIMQAFHPRDRSFSFNPRDTEPQFTSILKLAAGKDVRFYTIDSRGLYTSASLTGSSFDASHASTGRMGPTPQSVDRAVDTVGRENADVMAELARTTGGLFFENSNDLLTCIRKAFADGHDFYVLSYVPTNKALDGRFRKITVGVKHRDLRVNAKAGYWATE